VENRNLDLLQKRVLVRDETLTKKDKKILYSSASVHMTRTWERQRRDLKKEYYAINRRGIPLDFATRQSTDIFTLATHVIRRREMLIDRTKGKVLVHSPFINSQGKIHTKFAPGPNPRGRKRKDSEEINESCDS